MFNSTKQILFAANRLADDASELRNAYPILSALLAPTDLVALREHDSTTEAPLLDHACRALEIFNAIEEGDSKFPGPDSARKFLSGLCEHLDSKWKVAIRQALLFMDVSKGGTQIQRRLWNEEGIDLSIHNFASADLVTRKTDLLSQTSLLIRWHGMLGQFARGEVPWATYVSIPHANTTYLEAFLILNVCDTAAVRDDLLDEELWSLFFSSIELLREESKFVYDSKSRADRFAKLRRSRGETDIAEGFDKNLSLLPTHIRTTFEEKFDLANFWYCESALAGLSAGTQLKIIAFALSGVNTSTPFHISFHKISMALDAQTAAGRYRSRLLEAAFSKVELQSILVEGIESPMLVGVQLEIGDQKAVEVNLGSRKEADALITLLTIYETKSSAKFHAVLKILCDLYDLRKDTFDRVSNEQDYLDHMNSARSDKARMLDYTKEGRVVEIGPGGGVILDLLCERFPGSDIVGVDISKEVVNALTKIKEDKKSSWSILYGDAYELPQLFPDGFDTVIFCSLLHEIYSYVEDENGNKFQLASVENLIRAAYRGLKEGGRIIIRDGIAPSAGTRIIRFIDPEGPSFLKLFKEQFEGLEIDVQWIDSTTAKLSTQHAMEFLYCYTWGPSSFPYEVREQYGVLQYADYVDNILAWLSEEDVENQTCVKRVAIPDGNQSYLQPGYKTGLAPKIILLDGEMNPVELPDSNCLMVFEKQGKVV